MKILILSLILTGCIDKKQDVNICVVGALYGASVIMGEGKADRFTEEESNLFIEKARKQCREFIYDESGDS